jgi:hypothetical protein
MSASPVPAAASGAIAVAPSSLGRAAGALSALTGGVRAQAQSALSSPAVESVGDARCHEALGSASRLVAEALDASAGSLDELAGGLRSAAGAYSLADLLAFAPVQR